MGHIHRHAVVRGDGEGARRGARAGDLLTGAAHDIEVHVQLLIPQKLRAAQEGHKAGPVVHGLSADLTLPQGEAAPAVDNGCADRHGLLRLFLGHADVDEEVGQGHRLVGVPLLLDVWRQAGDHAEEGGIGENGQLPVGQHPGVDPANAAET